MVERSLIACNGIEVIGDCIYETKQIKQQQQQQKQQQQQQKQQQQTFNATLPYTQSLPRVYGCSSSSFLNFKPPFIRHNFQFLQKFKRMLEKQPRLFLRLYIYPDSPQFPFFPADLYIDRYGHLPSPKKEAMR